MKQTQKIFKNPSVPGIGRDSIELRELEADKLGLVFEYGLSGYHNVKDNPEKAQICHICRSNLSLAKIWSYENTIYPYSYYGRTFYFHKDEDTTEFIMRYL